MAQKLKLPPKWTIAEFLPRPERVDGAFQNVQPQESGGNLHSDAPTIVLWEQ